MVKMILSEKHGYRLTTSQRNGESLAKMCHQCGNDVLENVAAWSLTTYMLIWNSWVDWPQCSNKQKTEQLNKRVQLCEGGSSSLAPHCCSIHGRGRTGCEEQTESNANVKSQKMMWHFYPDFSLYLWFKSIHVFDTNDWPLVECEWAHNKLPANALVPLTQALFVAYLSLQPVYPVVIPLRKSQTS